MDTPYGDIPDRLARAMRPLEQHEYLQLSYGRRRLLKRAAVLGAAAVAGPVLWRQTGAVTGPAVGPGPQWIAFGGDPAAEMYVSWSESPGRGSFAGPRAPQVRWGTGSSDGSRQGASAGTVPVPAVTGEPTAQTVYCRTLLTGLLPGTTYRYSVSNDGVRWSPDATFTTGHHDGAGFRFTAFGDEATSMARAYPMAQLVAAQRPAFHLVAGDLAYATSNGIRLPDLGGFVPSRWNDYLKIVGPAAAQSVPWQAVVGAHETEPLGDDGYAGFVTRFPQAYDLASGSPVVRSFRYGNTVFVQLDGNDVSAQETVNAGYTRGLQTRWLARQLASFRASPGIDFIVVLCNCCGVPVPRTGHEAVPDQPLGERAAVVRARAVGDVQLPIDLEDRVRPPGMRERPLRPALRLLEQHQGVGAHVHPSSMLPSRSAVAVTTSPARTGTAAVKPPDNTMSPARRPSFSLASERTSQATAAAGWPSAAAPAAVATTSPLCSRTTPISRRSSPAAGTADPTR